MTTSVEFLRGETLGVPTYHSNEVLAVIGELGTDASTFTAGDVWEGHTPVDFGIATSPSGSQKVGTDGDVYDILQPFFNGTQIDENVIVVPIASTATLANIEAAVDAVENATHTPTHILIAGDLTGRVGGIGTGAIGQGLNPLVTKLDTFAASHHALALAWGAQVGRANFVSWGNANKKENCIGIASGELGGVVGRSPLGYIMNAIARKPRSRALNGLLINGAPTTQVWQYDGGDARLMAAANLAVVAVDGGRLRLNGGQLTPATNPSTDLERYWAVKDRMNYIKRTAQNFAVEGIIGHAQTLARKATLLNRAVSSIIGHDGITDITFAANEELSTAEHSYFELYVTMLVGTQKITIRTHIIA